MSLKDLAQATEEIENCETLDALRTVMHRYASKCGFTAVTLIDIGNRSADIPFHLGTAGQNWEQTYLDNAFVIIDPVVPHALVLNTPFCWSDVVKVPSKRQKKPAYMAVMEAAWDFGFTDGLLVPHHTMQADGSRYSTATAFYWTRSTEELQRALVDHRLFLQLITAVWAERIFKLLAAQGRREFQPVHSEIFNSPLTQRERDVLGSAAAGESVKGTAVALRIGTETVITHRQKVVEKLEVRSITAAVGRAAKQGWIDV